MSSSTQKSVSPRLIDSVLYSCKAKTHPLKEWMDGSRRHNVVQTSLWPALLSTSSMFLVSTEVSTSWMCLENYRGEGAQEASLQYRTIWTVSFTIEQWLYCTLWVKLILTTFFCLLILSADTLKLMPLDKSLNITHETMSTDFEKLTFFPPRASHTDWKATQTILTSTIRWRQQKHIICKKEDNQIIGWGVTWGCYSRVSQQK